MTKAHPKRLTFSEVEAALQSQDGVRLMALTGAPSTRDAIWAAANLCRLLNPAEPEASRHAAREWLEARGRLPDYLREPATP